MQNSFARTWFRTALVNLALAAILGTLMRFAFVNELKWFDYTSAQNAHANMALLGWAYQALFAMITGTFLSNDAVAVKRYRKLFWINQIIIWGIVINFIFFNSLIAGTTLTILFSVAVFIFIFLVLKQIQHEPKSSEHLLLKIALFFVGFSFIGEYLMLPALLLSGSKKILLYYISRQFFLHFQYNGWFTFAVLALIFKIAKAHLIQPDFEKTKIVAGMFVAAILLNFTLTLYWADQRQMHFLLIASIGALLQPAILFYYRSYLFSLFRKIILQFKREYRLLLILSLAAFLGRILMQCIAIHPFTATLAFTIRNYVVAYIHLVFIGFLSFFLLAAAFYFRYLVLNMVTRTGLIMFVSAFVFAELILFIQGTMQWTGNGFMNFYYVMIFGVTAALLAGLLIITFSRRRVL